ncbi:HOC1 (YJR075W) [Zygosaccharomyces parabailii]|uniref:BN860_16226g1_1 n=1 Tax=Zygosaccharomyces bailii (strain CLIB 213 / ATCC 58445 / CBS 680 / BCRC 21525 / NBRC 1098 / NCYC 1416 / NRRL Y-2227) TaxID=1333698 RepID=A0A8J2X9L5_ZYGB2|nr:HOC1 (YJR075W) [Zygosaccharomyces parabailii]CDF88693.1 BN860_16226g1_1 [Zygosaccharomyces bailii CLIB 213]CDH13240.1 related to glycosyltransferase HOC1 [Zygosaccharomyces bailii ISA1307]
MAKSNQGIALKRLLLFIVPAIGFIVLLFRFFNNSKAADLHKLLQNLPKEISQSINSAASHQKSDSDLIQQFENLANDLRRQQEDQAREFDRHRQELEKKLQELKLSPAQATLREKLSYNFRYDERKRFPAFIWQIGGVSGIEQLSSLEEMEKNWRDKNPGFVHEVITDEMMNALVRHYFASVPDVVSAYNALPSKVLKLDFFKYLILLARGGVYADMDTDPLQPVPNWIPENLDPGNIGLIVGVEHDADSPDWRSRYVRRLQFGTWVIQAKPGHPVVREVVAKVTEATLQRQREGSLNINLRNDLNIMGWTGSGVWTDVIFAYLNDYLRSGNTEKITWTWFHDMKQPRQVADLLVFPAFSFSAPAEIKNDDDRKALFLTHHEAKKSWKSVPKVEG